MHRFLSVILAILAVAVIVLSIITFQLLYAVQDLARSQRTVIARTGAILCSDAIKESVTTIFPCMPEPVP
jgi:CHASE3 domain sensor protein